MVSGYVNIVSVCSITFFTQLEYFGSGKTSKYFADGTNMFVYKITNLQITLNLLYSKVVTLGA